MKVLLIRPEDGLMDGPWTESNWSRVIDLGRAGAATYENAVAKFGTSAYPLDDLRNGFAEIQQVRELLARGFGRLTDRFDLDWWELIAILVHLELERVILLQKFAETLGPQDDVHVSGPGLHAEVLRLLLGPRVHVFSPTPVQQRSGARHYVRLLRKFPLRQLLEIFWDKNDPGYQFRGIFSGKKSPHTAPVVLLPSAYVNVSLTGIAYAKSLPDANFLLVSTRRSGWIENPPANVATAWLRSYASVGVPARKTEYADIVERWRVLRKELEDIPEFNLLSKLGYLDDFPLRFAHGLELRDAWRNVLENEPVQAVICADDSNPFTHIPLLLAKQKKLPTISCHHGALDGRYMFKRSHADVLLAKGKMEQDYLVRVCDVSPGRVEVGAPASLGGTERKSTIQQGKSAIVLFSEPYEAMGGRALDVYRDILPPLAELAQSQRRELIVKLHPAESISERRRFVNATLSIEQSRALRVVDGPLLSELLDHTWFGITILSTVAVECALRGIPCFLCKWLESSPYGYIDQFTRFGVGIPLQHPGGIKQIPALLTQHRPGATVTENCWKPAEAAQLRKWLGISREQPVATARH